MCPACRRRCPAFAERSIAQTTTTTNQLVGHASSISLFTEHIGAVRFLPQLNNWEMRRSSYSPFVVKADAGQSGQQQQVASSMMMSSRPTIDCVTKWAVSTYFCSLHFYRYGRVVFKFPLTGRASRLTSVGVSISGLDRVDGRRCHVAILSPDLSFHQHIRASSQFFFLRAYIESKVCGGYY